MIVPSRIRGLTRQMRAATIRATAATGDRAFSRRDRADLEGWLIAFR